MLKRTVFVGFCASMALGISAWAGPTGPFTFNFDGTTKPIWDISGTYILSPTVGGEVSISFPITIAEDASGKLTGSGTVPVVIDSDQVEGTYVLKGKISNSGGVALINATLKLSGTGTLQGFQSTYSVSASYHLEIDAATRTITGTGKGSAKASGLGQGPLYEQVSGSLPTGVDGSWALNMNLQTDVKAITGTSSVLLSNGRTLGLGVKGSYNAKNTKSNITLAGVDASKGASLKVMGTNDTLNVATVKGKLLGQVIK